MRDESPGRAEKPSGAPRRHWQMSLPLPWLLALRYLKSTRREAFVTFLSTLATGGISLGVAALILILAGLSGLQHFLRQDVIDRTPHVQIELPPDSDATAFATQLGGLPEVVEATQILRGRGWLRLGNRVLGAEMIGFDGSLPRIFPDPNGEGEGLYLSETVAAAWGIEAGELADLVSPRPTLTPFGPQPRVQALRVAGTFRSGRTEDGQQRLALPLAAARRLFGDRQVRLELRAISLEAALKLAEALPSMLPAGSRVRTWEDLNRGLFFALRLEKALMFVSVFLIVPIAAMALVTVLALLISSKRSEIGMLQAMGATHRELRRTFLILGSLLAGFGLAMGGGLGLLGAEILDRYRLLTPPGDVYFIDHIPFLVEAQDLFTIVSLTLLLTLVSTLFAARRAGAMRTVEVLRR